MRRQRERKGELSENQLQTAHRLRANNQTIYFVLHDFSQLRQTHKDNHRKLRINRRDSDSRDEMYS